MNHYSDESHFSIDSVTSPLSSCEILVVEDSPEVQRLIDVMLKETGATLTYECNGKAAIEHILYLSSVRQSFDLIILDFEMPGLNGIETTQILRETGFVLPILAITAFDNKTTRLEWFRAGCSSYLPKPFGKDELLTQLTQLMAARGTTVTTSES